MLVTEKCFVPDTAGEGKHRGGDAQRLSFRSMASTPITMTIRHERITYPPRGLLGGQNGAAAPFCPPRSPRGGYVMRSCRMVIVIGVLAIDLKDKR